MVSDQGDRDAAKSAFAATLQGARSARLWLQDKLQQVVEDEAINSAFAVSLMELATNIVDHAPQPADRFEVKLMRRRGALRLVLTADTHSFASSEEFRDLLQQEVSDVLATRGRGLMIVGHFFPDAQYQPPLARNQPESYVLEYRCGAGPMQARSAP